MALLAINSKTAPLRHRFYYLFLKYDVILKLNFKFVDLLKIGNRKINLRFEVCSRSCLHLIHVHRACSKIFHRKLTQSIQCKMLSVLQHVQFKGLNRDQCNRIQHAICYTFLNARLQTGRIMVWWCPSGSPFVRLSVRPSVRPGLRPSVRPFSALFSYILWHIELKFCTWLCFDVLQIKSDYRHFASIFEGVMPLCQLRI